MTEATQDEFSWARYYHATFGRSPSPHLLDAVGRFDTPGFAIDLGCGTGVETLALLARGWRVLAIDSQQEAIDLLRTRVPSELQEQLETQVVSFEAMELPKADLAWARASLSFCPPEHFDRAWGKIVTALQPGGRFAGDLFGNHHAWSHNPEMTFLTADRVKDKLQGLEIESLIEQDEAIRNDIQSLVHWHAFFIIARKAKSEHAPQRKAAEPFVRQSG